MDRGTSLTGKWRIRQEIYFTKQDEVLTGMLLTVLVPPCNFSTQYLLSMKTIIQRRLK